MTASPDLKLSQFLPSGIFGRPTTWGAVAKTPGWSAQKEELVCLKFGSDCKKGG